jgi:hypothetical protein
VSGVPEYELEAELRQLGAELAYPEVDLSAAVQARLHEKAPRRRRAWAPSWLGASRPWRRSRPWLWRAAVAALAVVMATGAVLAASPGARQAVAEWLGLRGVEVRYRDPSRPAAPAPPLGSTLSLGERLDSADARRGLSFLPLLPPPSGLGLPDEFYVSPFPKGGRLTVLYRARDGLPAAGPGGEGLLLTQFRGDVTDVAIRKLLGGGVRLEQVTVAGGPGYWFEGEPHQLFFADADGQFHEDRSRLAGNTLVWEQGDLTLRLESALSKADTIRLAESLRR